jgi:protein gp37
MGANSQIEWTDHTFNPWIGCQHVSPGCDHCYAERDWDHRYHRVQWGPHGERSRTTPDYWRGPLKYAKAARESGKRPRVFCASLADWLDNQVPPQWRTDLAALIAATPELDWLLLTKRIELFDRLAPWPRNAVPNNVWIGVTCESQEYFDRRFPLLRDIKAIKFISYEPAIGPLTLGKARPDWVICGGESGSGARFMHPAWARALRDECRAVGVAFFFKQMTGKKPIPTDLLVRQFPKRVAGGGNAS